MDYIRYLGMYIDKYRNFNFHIQQLSKNLSRINGSLSKRQHNALKHAYKSTMLSLMPISLMDVVIGDSHLKKTSIR